jgi:MoaA/NifB/PqqE/SkfB family radical SAM enzyme
MFNKTIQPALDWIQVEITTKCNAQCIYCPHLYFKETRDMPMKIFYGIASCLSNTNLVYLQGWGEPLLNDNLFRMIEFCKMKDKLVGFTTNGQLLEEKIIVELIDLKLDILCVSLAGTTSPTHNRLRKGNDFDQIISNLNLLRELKKQKNASKPNLHIAYLMLESNFEEMRNIILLVQKLGAKQVIASNLTLITGKKLFAEALFNNKQNYDYYSSVLEQIKKEALKKDIIFFYHNPIPSPFLSELNCSENICNALVIDVDGNVSPCVFTMPSLNKNLIINDNKIPSHYFQNQVFPLKEKRFGNIESESLFEIWNKKSYSAFRNYFDKTIEAILDSKIFERPECCAKCYKGLAL